MEQWLKTLRERWGTGWKIGFVLTVICFGFLISAEYGITRSVSTSLFISHYSSSFFPYAWIVSIPINFLVVYLYNRFLAILGCFRVFLGTVFLIALVNTLAAFPIAEYFPFFQFVWKDIYILLAFKQLWSLIHATISKEKAKYIYGVMFCAGATGAAVGGLIPSLFAVSLGSQRLFLFTAPIYLFVIVCYYLALKQSSVPLHEKKQETSPFVTGGMSGFSLIQNSTFLKFLLLVVVFMQISTAFLDYQFNVFLEKSISNLDLRTQYCGQLTVIINIVSVVLQVFGSWFLIRFLGLKMSHLLVPLFLCANSFAFFFFPTFAMASYSYACVKSLDYSLFGVVREMLYIPMKMSEKFQAKAIIDVFASRTAKACASFLILLIQFSLKEQATWCIKFLSLIIFLSWIGAVWFLFKEQEESLGSVN